MCLLDRRVESCLAARGSECGGAITDTGGMHAAAAPGMGALTASPMDASGWFRAAAAPSAASHGGLHDSTAARPSMCARFAARVRGQSAAGACPHPHMLYTTSGMTC